MKRAEHITVNHHDGYDCRKCHDNFERGTQMIKISGETDRAFLCMPCVAKLCTSRSAIHVAAGPVVHGRTIKVAERARMKGREG